MEWAGTGEGGGEGDGGEEERPELDAEVKKISNLMFCCVDKTDPGTKTLPGLCYVTIL